MQLKLDKRFWVVITCIIVVFTIFIVGRNLLHAIEIRKDIAILEQERAIYRARIEQDSTLLEELKYDDNLEQFARERYRMQRRVGRECKLFLQPEWSVSEEIMPLLVEYVKAHPAWNISIQTHKYMHIP